MMLILERAERSAGEAASGFALFWLEAGFTIKANSPTTSCWHVQKQGLGTGQQIGALLWL